ncbi:MAG: hypothetical protein JSS09_00795 [Verrucomicrobia bacterium]|nr:hypothetical protein [Verrucomicrobiota bacterium]
MDSNSITAIRHTSGSFHPQIPEKETYYYFEYDGFIYKRTGSCSDHQCTAIGITDKKLQHLKNQVLDRGIPSGLDGIFYKIGSFSVFPTKPSLPNLISEEYPDLHPEDTLDPNIQEYNSLKKSIKNIDANKKINDQIRNGRIIATAAIPITLIAAKVLKGK